MNFGPLNQDFGANRLNVLLTRAKQKMVVVSSVKSSDFKLSDNRGVQLLQDFLRFCETDSKQIFKMPDSFTLEHVSNLIKEKSNVSFLPAMNGQAVNCFVDYASEKVLLIDPTLYTEENKDVYTILDVLSQRFTSVKVLLSQDLWNDKERFDKDVISYFD